MKNAGRRETRRAILGSQGTQSLMVKRETPKQVERLKPGERLWWGDREYVIGLRGELRRA